MFPRVTGAPIGTVTPTSAIFTDIHRMTGHLIQVCRLTMAFSREGPRPECQDAPTAVEIGVPRSGSSEIAFISAHLVLGSFWNAQQPSPSRWRWIRRRPQFGDQWQNLGEQHSWHGDLGHLEGDIATVVNDLRANLDEFLAQAGQRPRLTRTLAVSLLSGFGIPAEISIGRARRDWD